MAFYDDFNGVYFTLQALGLYHGEDLQGCEILLVDNHPGSPESKRIQGLGAAWSGASREVMDGLGDLLPSGIDLWYVPAGEVTGTSAPRNLVFEKATRPAVMCMDSHVLLAPGSIRKLREYYYANPDTGDLLTGPRLADNLRDPITHFQDVWRDDMWGIWGHHPSGCDPSGPPFAIAAHGLGLFTCRKDAWLGFNENFRGFGGEEFYIHTKFRQAGHKCLSLPFLRWVHRFGRSGQYPLSLWHRLRNYVIGHQELGLPLDRVYRHFVLREPEQLPDGSLTKMPGHRISQEQWDYLLADPVAHETPKGEIAKSGCAGCGGGQSVAPKFPPPENREQWFQQTCDTPSDINEHVLTLRRLATGCEHVTEFGHRIGISTVGLLAGQPGRLVSYDRHRHNGAVAQVEKFRGTTVFEFRQAETATAEIEETDLLFIDTRHTAEQLTAELRQALKVRRWIALHDTMIFGEKGEDGGPGLLVALRQFMRENPQWSVIFHAIHNHGFTVIGCQKQDKPPLPNKIKMAANFAKAVVSHVATGAGKTDADAFGARLERCTLCEQRTEHQCAACGCFIETKAEWAEQVCPLGRWPA
jgi:hypothetical protein